jgi:hypothetical protein
VWINNDELYAQGDSLSSHLEFDELGDIIREVAHVAEALLRGNVLNKQI